APRPWDLLRTHSTITRRRLRGPDGLAGLPLDYYTRFGDAALRCARAGWAPLRFAPACAHGRRRAHPIRPSQPPTRQQWIGPPPSLNPLAIRQGQTPPSGGEPALSESLKRSGRLSRLRGLGGARPSHIHPSWISRGARVR